jgi:hypothetical protein
MSHYPCINIYIRNGFVILLTKMFGSKRVLNFSCTHFRQRILFYFILFYFILRVSQRILKNRSHLENY